MRAIELSGCAKLADKILRDYSEAIFRILILFSFLVLFSPVSASADCDPATTCNGNGTCSASGACVCNPGFTGASCNQCATNYYNYPQCKYCNASTTCNGRGNCNALGACVCNPGFVGASCNSCAANYYNYPDCKYCDASATCSGKGTCNPSSGACVCNTGFAGTGCDSCAPNYYNYPNCTFCNASTTCNSRGSCNALGACVCMAGYSGAACNQCASGFTGYPNCVPGALPSPAISTISPTTAPSSGGVKLVISGANFGTTGKVMFGTQPCAIQSYADSKIECELPAGQGKELAIVVQYPGINSNAAKFSYLPPQITSINPASGPAAGGTLLTVSGTSFGLKGSVTVGGKACPVSVYEHTRITCTVPAGSGAKLPVAVIAGGQISNLAAFTYSP